ncbi:MAG: acetaldehyde dehydrogenase (acetylating) [Oscillospiraceae bacterium]
MQLYDKDLLSLQEVRGLIARSVAAQAQVAAMTQPQVDKLVKAIADAGVKYARKLAEMAVEETGFGVVQDKVIKNIFASSGVYDRIKDLKTVGIIAGNKDEQIMDIAVPVGVVAGLVPSTNPTSTVIFKAQIAIKAANSIIFSPHPNAKKCILETVRILRDAIAQAGGPEDLVLCISIPTAGATEALMKHKDTKLILATGGSAMVRAAYSSGTPAIGVGPGNGPAYIERSADLKQAVKRIIDSKTFDNGTICASEQSVITEPDMKEAVKNEMQSQGAYFLSKEQADKLGKFILRANGTMNPAIVGKTAQVIAQLAEIEIPKDTKVLVAEESGVGVGHPYSNEKLAPILGFYTAENYKEVCKRCVEILNYEGAGHTFMIHSKNKEIIEYFATRVPVSRFLVNTAGALGGVGATTYLMPSYTLGSGAVGGSSTSENVGPLNLMNIRKVAHGIRDLDDIRRDTKVNTGTSTVTTIDVDNIVKMIIEKMQNN